MIKWMYNLKHSHQTYFHEFLTRKISNEYASLTGDKDLLRLGSKSIWVNTKQLILEKIFKSRKSMLRENRMSEWLWRYVECSTKQSDSSFARSTKPNKAACKKQCHFLSYGCSDAWRTKSVNGRSLLAQIHNHHYTPLLGRRAVVQLELIKTNHDDFVNTLCLNSIFDNYNHDGWIGRMWDKVHLRVDADSVHG